MLHVCKQNKTTVLFSIQISHMIYIGQSPALQNENLDVGSFVAYRYLCMSKKKYILSLIYMSTANGMVQVYGSWPQSEFSATSNDL